MDEPLGRAVGFAARSGFDSGLRVCLPNLPRATRVASEAKELRRLTMVFTVLAERRNSPFRGRPSASTATVWDKSPLDTASDQPPSTGPMEIRWVILPSLPTPLFTLSNSRTRRRFMSRTSLNTKQIFPSMPSTSSINFALKSPCLNASRAWSNFFLSRPVYPFW